MRTVLSLTATAVLLAAAWGSFADESAHLQDKCTPRPTSQPTTEPAEQSAEPNLPSRVLVVTSAASWEYRHLRGLLLREKGLELTVWQQNADAEVSQEQSNGQRLEELPSKLGELCSLAEPADRGFDVIVLMDPAPDKGRFNTTFASLLASHVKLGGGLIYQGGPRNTLAMLKDPNGPYRALGQVLPVAGAYEQPQDAQGAAARRPPLPLKATAQGREHPLLKHLARNEGDPAEFLAELPGFYAWQPFRQVRKGATVLAELDVPPHLTRKGQPVTAVVVGTFGKGRALFLGSGETWRWRQVEEGAVYQRFWRAALGQVACPAKTPDTKQGIPSEK